MLTSVEYKIIKLLMEMGEEYSLRRKIFETVWEDYFMGDDNTIMFT